MRGGDLARGADLARAATAAALLVVLLAVAWAGLHAGPAAGRVALLALLAVLPVAARLSPRAGAGLTAGATAASVAGLLALAARVSLGDLLTLDADAWATVAAIVPDGVREASGTSLPLDAAEAPALAGLLDLALMGIAGCVAWQAAVRRRPLAAIAGFGLGMGYRWTVVAPDHPVLWGSVALAAALLTLRLVRPASVARWRRAPAVGRVAVAGSALVALSAALAAGPARGGDGWWDWRSWDLSSRGGSYALDLDQDYGKLTWPDDPVPLLRVRSTRQMPLRAVAFGRFDGIRFAQDVVTTRPLVPVGGRVTTGEPLPPGERPVVQRIELLAGDTPLVLAGGRPVAVTAPFGGRVDLVDDAIRVDPPLRRGERYVVETRIHDPGPRLLLEARPAAPGEVPDRLLELSTGAGFGVRVPLWGTGPRPRPEAFGPYADVYRLSRTWIGDAATVYQAVNRIESRLRGGYVYDERPPFPPAGVPPIADFLLTTRRGFCQHFAGAMALMLRMNGIPARVAVGFASGRYDASQDAYEVVDRDAHSWVEVWFPDYGWLPFDPTPASGRFAPNSASVSNPDYVPPDIDVELAAAPVRPPETDPPVRRSPDPGQEGVPLTHARVDRGVPAWIWVAMGLGIALAGLGAVPAAKALRRLRRRRAADPRERVIGAVRELESTLADLGMAPHPALTSSERGESLRAAMGLDAGELYRRAAEARFASRPPARDVANWCWRESSRLRRDARRRVSPGSRLASRFRVTSLRRATLSRG